MSYVKKLALSLCGLACAASAMGQAAGITGRSSADRLLLTVGQAAQVDSDNKLAFSAFVALNEASDGGFVISAVGLNTALGLAADLSQTAGLSALNNPDEPNANLELRSIMGRPRLSDDAIADYYSFLLWSLGDRSGFELKLDNEVRSTGPVKLLLFSPNMAQAYRARIEDSDEGAVISTTAGMRGAWRTPFHPINSFEGKFDPGKAKSYKVEYMSALGDFRYWNDISNGVEYLEMPFVDAIPLRAVSAIVVLPARGRNTDKIIEKNMNPKSWELAMNRIYTNHVSVSIPQFSIDNTISLRPLLTQMGAASMWGEEDDSDNGLFVDMVQTAGLSVGLDGIDPMPVDAKPAEFKRNTDNVPLVRVNVDRPFVFVICDRNTGAILFMAKITDVARK